MAWLYEHPRSRNWFIGWRVSGKQFNRSTGTPDRKQAEKKLGLHNLMAAANRDKRLTEDFFYSLIGKEVQRATLRDCADKFLSGKRSKQPGTFVRYNRVLDSFCEYLHAGDTAPLIADVNGETIQSFLNEVRSRTTASTANFYYDVLRAFFNHAVDNGKLSDNPTAKIESFKPSMEEAEHQRRGFDAPEIKLAYQAAPNAFWRFAIVCGLYTGLRLGNVATLRWSNFQNQTLTVIDIKDHKELTIPVCSPFLQNMLAELRRRAGKVKPEAYIFDDYATRYLPASKHGENNSASLSLEFHSILVKAGLLEEYQRTNQGNGRSCRRTVSPLSFHSLRHTFVSTLTASGAPQMVARELAGHSSDQVNELYTHTPPELLRKSLKRLPEVFK
jgi:integrase